MFDFPLWLVFALISPAFWAIVHVLDAYSVDELFDDYWMGTVTSAIAMAVLLPVLLLGLFFVEINELTLTVVLLSIAAGTVFMSSQILYFRALSFSESGIVAAYWNLIPVLLLVISYFFFNERLTFWNYVGSACVVLSSVAFCMVDGNIESRWKSFTSMMTAALMQTGYFLLVNELCRQADVFPVFVIVTLAMIATGLLPLVAPSRRIAFLSNIPRLMSSIKILIAIELANLVALATSQYAVSYGPVSLVATVEASIPAYAFCFSFLLYAVFKKYGEEEARRRLPAKMVLVTVMVLGVWLIT